MRGHVFREASRLVNRSEQSLSATTDAERGPPSIMASSEHGYDPLLAVRRRHRHLEEPSVEQIATIASIPGGEQYLAGFEILWSRRNKQQGR